MGGQKGTPPTEGWSAGRQLRRVNRGALLRADRLHRCGPTRRAEVMVVPSGDLPAPVDSPILVRVLPDVRRPAAASLANLIHEAILADFGGYESIGAVAATRPGPF